MAKRPHDDEDSDDRDSNKPPHKVRAEVDKKGKGRVQDASKKRKTDDRAE